MTDGPRRAPGAPGEAEHCGAHLVVDGALLVASPTHAEPDIDTVRSQVAASVVAGYPGRTLTATAHVLLSDDPDAFLSPPTTVAERRDEQSRLMADSALDYLEVAAQREVRRIDRTRDRLAVELAEIDEKAAVAGALLERWEERAETRAGRAAVRTAPEASPAAAPASGRTGAAVAYATAQVGKSYVWAAAGPSSFDCSGLTMAAWAQAGVSPPHSSQAQMGSGTPVSQSELQPGDLVVCYSPVVHVGMYIGNGQVVNALSPSSGIQVPDVNSMPYSGAVRPG